MKNLKTGIVIGDYKLEDRLAKGTFGETWKAFSANQELVAVQFVANELYAKTIAQSSYKFPSTTNPNVSKLVEWDKQNQMFVWEYVAGRKLSVFIQRLKKIKLSIAVYIARKILEALSYSASQGLVHGCLRPSRVAITSDKKIRLTHFGLGKLEQQILYDLYQKKDSVIKDIQIYFAPEVLEDKIFEDPKSDIYSVGIILCDMLLGEKFTRQEIPKKLTENNIPKNLINIILKSIADFGMRYNHPNEMHRDLTKLLKLSESKEKIYVNPPVPGNPEKNALEAVPADSEEYRVYQADHNFARQSIDAGVVVAEPAEPGENEEEEEEKQQITEEEAKEKIKHILQKTGRIDVESVMFGTFGDTMLTPLEKVPIWPQIFIKYTIAALIFLGFGFFCAISPSLHFFIDGMSEIILLPFYITSQWPPHIQNIIFWFILLNVTALITLPFWDWRGKLTLNNFFIPFYMTTMAGLISLSLWRSIAQNTVHGIILVSILLGLGIIAGMITPHVSRFLRRQW
ncbi:protein kinase domain-containing protein [Candidatus Uabimicrobium amorphum]|uniref:Protein kinase n=1 Tax=Uabimicrobium amorphum TaxID=2596890 RepID=A0A5S9IQQ7_UABAM|nr:protein kinase [Candidatus Uabimicrobium amorphum]BBM84945.1 protein kinase [Candidatus Uabimicrobium amorphum]